MPINLNRFDLISLRLLIASLETGSLSAGAQRLGISTAAASKRIAELEARVGAQLLTRGKKGVAPTEAGLIALQHATQAMADIERLALALDDYRHGIGGSLRIWANPSAFAGFLPALLARFLADIPTVQVDLAETLSEKAVRAVLAGKTELAIVGENTFLQGLHAFVCDIDELVLLLPRNHPMAHVGTIEFSQAVALDLVALSRPTSLTRHISTLAAAAGKSLKIRVQVRNFDALCRMVSVGIGASIVPRAAGNPHLDSLGLAMIRFAGPPIQRKLLLAMRDRQALSPPARKFVALAERRVAENH